MDTLKAGVLAYIDSFGGLVPCKVLRVLHDSYFNMPVAEVKVTASRPGYSRGDVDRVYVFSLVRRDGVRRRGGKQYVKGFAGFELTEEASHAV